MLPETWTHVATFQSRARHSINMSVGDYICVIVDHLDEPCILQSDLMCQQSHVLEDCSGSKLQQVKQYMKV